MAVVPTRWQPRPRQRQLGPLLVALRTSTTSGERTTARATSRRSPAEPVIRVVCASHCSLHGGMDYVCMWRWCEAIGPSQCFRVAVTLSSKKLHGTPAGVKRVRVICRANTATHPSNDLETCLTVSLRIGPKHPAQHQSGLKCSVLLMTPHTTHSLGQ